MESPLIPFYFNLKMKKLILLVVLPLSMVIFAFTFVDATQWKISSKYSVKFIAGEHNGSLKGLKGIISFNENEIANSTFNISFDVKTINLGDAESTNHAKEKQWLDEQNHPTISFASSEFTKTENGFTVKGNLKIKSVVKEINFPFTFTKNSKVGIFKGGFEINPIDYSISEEGIGNSIKIEFQIGVKR